MLFAGCLLLGCGILRVIGWRWDGVSSTADEPPPLWEAKLVSFASHHAYMLGGARLRKSGMHAVSTIYELNIWESSGAQPLLDDDTADDNSRFADDTQNDDPLPPEA